MVCRSQLRGFSIKFEFVLYAACTAFLVAIFKSLQIAFEAMAKDNELMFERSSKNFQEAFKYVHSLQNLKTSLHHIISPKVLPAVLQNAIGVACKLRTPHAAPPKGC